MSGLVGLAGLAQVGLALGIVYTIGRVLYNIFLHPLRKFPGPLSHSISTFPIFWHNIHGTLPFHVDDLHKRYGPVVRLSPYELVFCSPQAWRDIYGHKKAGEEEFPKSTLFYKLFKHRPTTIINAGRQEHGLLRRQLAHGFSDRSMREQEPIINSYVELLMSRLTDAVRKSSSQNMREWYNWTTFDVIGDLSFGVDGGFGCLQNSDYHPWVSLINTSIRQLSQIAALSLIGFSRPIQWIFQSGLLADSEHQAIVSEKVAQRMESGERPDFLEGLIRRKDELKLDHKKMSGNASLLVIAGSETTATLLSGATFLLTTHPEALKKLQQEVRSAFKSSDEITLLSVGNLSYMLACLNEALRCYPPVANGLPRQAPPKGGMVDGNFIPGNTVVSIYQWAINHDEHFWKHPNLYAPERWLGDPEYKGDQLDAMQPFSVGPRNCIGRNLAYAEMRLILAKIVYNFDMTLADDSKNWLRDQKAFTVWEKPALNVHLKPVVR